MRFYLRRFAAAVVIVSFVFNITGCATYKIHPEFKARHKDLKSASIMPPEVDAYILNFQGDKKRLDDVVPVMAEATIKQLERSLIDKGYIIRKMDLSEAALTAKPELRTALFNVNKLFAKAVEDIQKNKQKKFTYGLGSDVNIFADMANCNMLIFVKEEGIKKSAGEVAKDLAKGLAISAACILIGAIYIPVPQTSITVAHLAVVDSNDGAVLWYNNNISSVNYDPSNKKHIAVLIKSLFAPFPNSLYKGADQDSENQ